MRHHRTLSILAALAITGLFIESAQAWTGKGRTRAIRAGIAKHINAHPVAHVNLNLGTGQITRQVKPNEIRFRSKKLPSMVSVVGSAERSVSWRLKSGMLAGKAKASTPMVPKGGALTRVDQVQYTTRPRGMPSAFVAQQNSRMSREFNPKIEMTVRGTRPGSIGRDRAIRAATGMPFSDSAGAIQQMERHSGHARGTRGYNEFYAQRSPYRR